MTEAISLNEKSTVFHTPILSNANVGPKTEEMCGDVILQGPDKQKRYVHIKVYRTSLEHFAVVYPLKRLSKPLGIINIRNTCITQLPQPPYDSPEGGAPAAATAAIVINQRMFDVTTSVTLHCDASQLTAWTNAFTSRSSPTLIHQTSLPIVKEEDAD